MEDKTQHTVLVFIINDKNEVLLYRRINTWYENDKLHLVGGLVEKEEAPLDAALREVREETTLKLDSLSTTLITTIKKKSDHNDVLYINHYFLSRNWTGIPTNTEPERCGELVWHSLLHLPTDTAEVVKEVATLII